MTRKFRTIIFAVLLILFFITAPSAVLYSYGYRFDFTQKKVVQTGAFYFKTSPRNAEIYLGDKMVAKTDILFGSAFVENLLPQKYEIEIKKEGFFPWEKSLEIKEREVTEAKNIILFPQNPNFTILTKNKKEIKDIISNISSEENKNEPEISQTLKAVLDSALSYQLAQDQIIWLDEKRDLYQGDSAGREIKKIADGVRGFAVSPDFKKISYFNNYEIWVLFLKTEEGQPKKSAGDKVFLTRFSEEIGDVFWIASHYLIFNAGDKIKIAGIDERDRLNIYDLAEFKNQKIFWDQKEKFLYVLSGESLFISKTLLP